MKVYVVNGSSDYRDMFKSAGWSLHDYVDGADLIQFCGGADVSPSIYGQTQHPFTNSYKLRDSVEVSIWKDAKSLDIPCAGICRGGQLLNVLNGGTMYQHVDGHGMSGTHVITDISGEEFNVTSTHHQMMNPSNDGQILAVSNEATFKEVCYGGEVFTKPSSKIFSDVEVVHYPENKDLCFQPHPEYHEETCKYYFKILNRTLFGG